MSLIMAVRPEWHALAGVFNGLTAIMTSVDQSRVIMALLAVMARTLVTQGACQGVPISGVIGPRVRGQVTSPSSLSSGAAQSEPHEGVPPARGVHSAIAVTGCGGRVYPGLPGAVSTTETRTTRTVTSAYTGAVQGLGQAGQGQERCQDQCQN